MTRFRLDELVDLGDGWVRLPESGEELFRIVLAGIPWARWFQEHDLARFEFGTMQVDIESMVVPDQAAAAPRVVDQLELPLGSAPEAA